MPVRVHSGGADSKLSLTTKIDHYAMILYSILDNEKLSQLTLEDTFNDSVFKIFFNLEEIESVCRSSISERLSKIDQDYFKQIYECIHDQFSELYSLTEREEYNLICVDSLMVSESVGKLMEGLHNKSGNKEVKYSIAFDGVLPCHSNVFTSPGYSSEDVALREAVMGHVKKET